MHAEAPAGRYADDGNIKNIEDLYDASIFIVQEGLKSGGHYIMKTFFSEVFKPKQRELKELFAHVSVFKPVSSRNVSSETYFVCKGKTK